MFNAGAARLHLKVQNPVEGVDALGAPATQWVDYVELFAATENESFEVSDSMASGPRREATKTFTAVIRNHPQLAFNTRQRFIDLDSLETFAVASIRYDAKRTQCFVDLVGGVSKGG